MEQKAMKLEPTNPNPSTLLTPPANISEDWALGSVRKILQSDLSEPVSYSKISARLLDSGCTGITKTGAVNLPYTQLSSTGLNPNCGLVPTPLIRKVLLTVSRQSSPACISKSSWPELLGAKGETAAATIERENPLVNAVIVLEGTIVTKDFLCTRVRVWVDDCGIVTRVPVIG
ncbi:hypothetical protein TEA_026296 [Camellia sinensis var. sinensis]|uniref:Uncharacterized protein n=1 Tax=Camellia sinensis var. sinensis TaxID=542762 RepID=A0A4S4DCD1_CAMSN|nr:hypothetical protein TEA_026296 [Camellia sinensis var. sinensis]